MKMRRTKTEAKPITITVERLSDNSRITFTISSDKTIEQLRALLNHHLPPLSSGKFDLYSYQRGALIHFHPSTFKLDYFPVIFDQQVLLLKMDDRIRNHTNLDLTKTTSIKRTKCCPSIKSNECYTINDCSPTKSSPMTTRSNSPVQSIKHKQKQQHQNSSSASSLVTCLTILKRFFHQSSSNVVNTNVDTEVLTY